MSQANGVLAFIVPPGAGAGADTDADAENKPPSTLAPASCCGATSHVHLRLFFCLLPLDGPIAGGSGQFEADDDIEDSAERRPFLLLAGSAFRLVALVFWAFSSLLLPPVLDALPGRPLSSALTSPSILPSSSSDLLVPSPAQPKKSIMSSFLVARTL